MQFYKNWPSWLKGGIIGILVSIVSTVLFFWDIVKNTESVTIITDIMQKLCLFYTQCENFEVDAAYTGYKCVGCIVYSPLFFGITCIIMGAIIGLIIGKFNKSKS